MIDTSAGTAVLRGADIYAVTGVNVLKNEISQFD
jgi:hypothetical protein